MAPCGAVCAYAVHERGANAVAGKPILRKCLTFLIWLGYHARLSAWRAVFYWFVRPIRSSVN
jgi:hypothetical protein